MDDKRRESMYRAESSVFEYSFDAGPRTQGDLQAIANLILGSAWWRRNGRKVATVVVTVGRDDSEAWFEGRCARIHLHEDDACTYMLFHELAHIAQGADAQVAEHSLAWLALYCGLVRHWQRTLIYSERLWNQLAPYFE